MMLHTACFDNIMQSQVLLKWNTNSKEQKDPEVAKHVGQ